MGSLTFVIADIAGIELVTTDADFWGEGVA
jgi:hypothetical protein